jgi:hypothetical protein
MPQGSVIGTCHEIELVTKRLARILLLLANFGREGRPEPIVGKLTQETLAEIPIARELFHEQIPRTRFY